MPTITLSLPVAGTVITAGLHATNYASIQAAVNALDNNNIAVGAGILQSKIAFDAWQAFVPVWGSDGTAPALNNGTITGKFVQVGKTIHAVAVLIPGSTSTFGTGNYTITLPVTAADAAIRSIGTVHAFDTSAAARYLGGAVLVSTTTTRFINTAAPGGFYTNAAPFTWATSDELRYAVTYEAA